MNSPRYAHVKIFLGLFAGLFVIAVALYVIANQGQASSGSASHTPEPTTTITTGELACLPHRATVGPVTQECALGLKVNDTTYDALDTALYPSELTAFTIGQLVRVTGTVLSVSELTDKTVPQTYAIAGMIKVADVEPVQ